MAPKALIAWSFGTAVVGASAFLLSLSWPQPLAVEASRQAAAPNAGAGAALAFLLPPPDLPAAITPDVLSLPPDTTPARLDHAMSAEALFGPPSALASTFGRPPAFLEVRPPLAADGRPAAPEAATSPVQEVIRSAASRDTTLSRLAVRPPPRPAFPDTGRAPGPESAGIVEVRPSAVAPGWSEAALGAPGWPALAPVAQENAAPSSSRPGRALQAGVASWYGPGFHGRKTASGERFDQNAMTAAHRYLPFGTRVKVVDPKSGRSVVVRINDRGPFAHGRVIDLSKASAQALGMDGLARVQLVSAE